MILKLQRLRKERAELVTDLGNRAISLDVKSLKAVRIQQIDREIRETKQENIKLVEA